MKLSKRSEIKALLDRKVDEYNRSSFIESDPISIPHQFSDPLDQEIAGFFAAIFSWGNRTTIIRKSQELMQLMGNAPIDFVRNASQTDLRSLSAFKHRTFNATDLLYILDFMKRHYAKHSSLQMFFQGRDVKDGLSAMHSAFFEAEYAPQRTRKHIGTPERGSACKRLNMYLRWMVRKDEGGVDLGIWQQPEISQLMVPLDVHVHRIALKLGLMKRKIADWRACEELTATLRTFDPSDPVKYDYALFMLGIEQKNASG